MNVDSCAFCGSKEYRIATILDEQWYVECLDLDCAVFGPCGETEEEAIQKWNTRHYDDALAYVRKLETLQAQLDKTTALYGGACERMEKLEAARDHWHDLYQNERKTSERLSCDASMWFDAVEQRNAMMADLEVERDELSKKLFDLKYYLACQWRIRLERWSQKTGMLKVLLCFNRGQSFGDNHTLALFNEITNEIFPEAENAISQDSTN